MLKEQFHDLFTEGLGDIFFMKIYNLIQKIQNKTIKKILLGIHVLFFIIFLMAVTVIIFKLSFPI